MSKLQAHVLSKSGPAPDLLRQIAATAARVHPTRTQQYAKYEHQQPAFYDTDADTVADTTTASFDPNALEAGSSGHGEDEDEEEDGSEESDDEADANNDPSLDSQSLSAKVDMKPAQAYHWNSQHRTDRQSQAATARTRTQRPRVTNGTPSKPQTLRRAPELNPHNLPHLPSSSSPPQPARMASHPKNKQGPGPQSYMNKEVREQGTSVFTRSELGSEAITRYGINGGDYEAASSEDPSISKRTLELDYPSDVLAKKSFSALQLEDFDHDPNKKTPDDHPDDVVSESLAVRFARVSKAPAPTPDTDPDHGEREDHDLASLHYHQSLVAFFSSLTIDQYDECGDIIVDQFTAMLAKFKDLRREKRKAAVEFETEVASRDGAVKERQTLLAEDMARLRSQGEGFMGRK